MEKTRKWRKILAMMLTVVMMLQNAQSVMVFADVTNEQIEQRLAGNQGQTEETQPAQSQVDTRANGEEYKTQSQETQENGNGSTDIGSPESGNTTTEAKTSNADVSATITQSVFQADVSGTTCNFVQMTAQITNNDAENPATGVSVKALLNSAQLSWVNGYGTETAGAGAYAVDSNNTADLPDGSADGYDQIVMWTDQTIGAGETVAYQFAAQIIPENLDGVVNAWYVDGTSCSYTWENTEVLNPVQTPEADQEETPSDTTQDSNQSSNQDSNQDSTQEATPTPEVTETSEATPIPEVTETPTSEVTKTPEAEPTQAADDKKAKAAKKKNQQRLLAQRGMEDEADVQEGEDVQPVVGEENATHAKNKDIADSHNKLTFSYSVKHWVTDEEGNRTLVTEPYNGGAIPRDYNVDIKLTFEFDDINKPTATDATGYTYTLPTLPEGFTLTTAASGDVKDPDNNTAGRYQITGNTVTFNYNPTYFQTHTDNIKGTFWLRTDLDENRIKDKGQVSFTINGQTQVIKYKDGTLDGSKTYEIDSDGNLIFTIVLKAGTDADAKNVKVTDTLTGKLQFANEPFAVKNSRNEDVSYTVSDVEGNSQQKIITIPSIPAGETITITYKVLSNYSQEGSTDDSNTATWEWGNGTGTGQDGKSHGESSTGKIDLKNQVLTKKGVIDVDNNKINYTIQINPFAQKLIPDGTQTDGMLELTDTIENFNALSMAFDTSSVHVMSGGTDLLATGRATFNFSKGTLNLKIPDQTAITLEYTVNCYGEVGEKVPVKNKVNLIGKYEKEITTNVTIQESGSTIEGDETTIRFKKVGQYAGNPIIENAEFKLYEYDMETKTEPKDPVEIVKSDSNGMVVFGTGTYKVKTDTLYYIQESKSAEGYILNNEKHYFAMYKAGATKAQRKALEDKINESYGTLIGNNQVTICKAGSNLGSFENAQIPQKTSMPAKAIKKLDGQTFTDSKIKFSYKLFLKKYQPDSNSDWVTDNFEIAGNTEPTAGTNTESDTDSEGNKIEHSKALGTDSEGNIIGYNQIVSAGSNIEFPNIVFEYAGTYTFIMREIIPDDSNTYAYDKNEKTITVEVGRESSSGNLIVKSVSPDIRTASNTVFNNRTTKKLTLKKVTESKSSEKTTFTFNLTGTDTDNSKFNFDGVKVGNQPITKTNEGAKVTIDVDKDKTEGTVILTGIPTGVTINIEETNLPSGWHLVDEKSTKVVEMNQEQEATITNKYNENGEINFSVAKSFNDWSLGEKFEFKLESLKNAPEPLNGQQTTVTLAATKNTKETDTLTGNFGTIKYNTNGTYYYKISEVIPQDTAGINYDTSVTYVKVVVTSKGAGKKKIEISTAKADENANYENLEYSSTEQNAATATFTNNVSGASIKFTATKGLTGRKLKDKEFEFKVKEGDGENAKVVATGTNDENGNIEFSSIYYKSTDLNSAGEKEYRYTVLEVNDNKQGVTYDSQTYNVTVKVSKYPDGTLKVECGDQSNRAGQQELTYAIPCASGKTKNFENQFTASTSIRFKATKKLVNKELQENQFSFVMTDAGTKREQVVSNDKDGNIVFPVITYTQADLMNTDGTFANERTYQYTIEEDKANKDDNPGIIYSDKKYTVNVTLSLTDKGTLKTDITVNDGNSEREISQTGNNQGTENNPYIYALTDDSTFVNKYSADAIKVNLVGKKKLENQDLTSGTYKFKITANIGTPSSTITDKNSVTNDEEGNITFPTLRFDLDALKDGNYPVSTKTFEYTISEVKESIPGITYGEEEYQVSITVNNTKGILSANGKVTKVKDTDGNEINPSTVVAELRGINKDTNKAFSITPGKNSFVNVYNATTSVQIKGTKEFVDTLSNSKQIDNDAFSFEISGPKLGKDGKQTVSCSAGGEFTFPDITYSITDLKGENGEYQKDANGNYTKSFTYTVKEVIPDGAVDNVKNGITYNTTKREYTVVVTITDDKSGELKQSVAIKKGTDGNITGAVENNKGVYTLSAGENKATFTNVYDATTEYSFKVVKRLVGREFKDGDNFKFELLKGRQRIQTISLEVGQDGTEIKADADGNKYLEASFDPQKYGLKDVNKTYEYTIRELNPETAMEGVTIDDDIYIVDITVTDHNDGTLTATAKRILGDDENDKVDFENAVFINTYKAEGTAQIVAKKFLSPGDIGAEKFTFTLTQIDQNGTVVEGGISQTKQNEGNSIVFDPIAYHQKGEKDASGNIVQTSDAGKTFWYEIKETAGTDTKYTYDNKVYKVKVDVSIDPKDNRKLVTTQTIYDATGKETSEIGEKAEAIVFTNRYEATGSITLTGKKVVEGEQKLTAKEFNFEVKEGVGENAKVVAIGTNDEDGNIQFSEIKYAYNSETNDLGEHIYTVTEVQPKDGDGYVYDLTSRKVVVKVTDNQDKTLKAEIIAASEKDAELKSDVTNNVINSFINKQISITIRKNDANKARLADAELALFEYDNEKKAKTGDAIDTWTTSKDNDHTITGKLVAGKTYILEETKAPDGYAEANPIIFTIKNDGVRTIEVVSGGQLDETGKVLIMVDQKTGVQILKVDEKGKGVPGAELAIFDGDKQIGASWTTDGQAHVIEGLTAGKTYTLKELKAPSGYKKAEDKTFTIDASKVVEVRMEDKTIKLSIMKVDGNGQGLKGADLEIRNKNNELIDKWTSETTEHVVDEEKSRKLVEGEEYTLIETKAPEGYALANPKTFTIKSSDTVTKVTMENVPNSVIISKKSLTGIESIGGAKLRVLDPQGNEVVKTWTTEKGKDKAVTGVFKPNVTYTLEEVEAPEGYRKAANIMFSLNETGEIYVGNTKVTSVVMRDALTKASILKVDESGKGIAGADLVIKDSKGNIKATWTSDGTPHAVEGVLKVGETYTLSETKAPSGYTVAPDQTFKMEDKDVIEVTMVDYQASGSGQITVTKKVTYANGGDFIDLIAQDDTFYVNLFTDAAGKYPYKGALPQAIHLVNASAGSVTFSDLAQGTYYVYETDANGNVINLDQQGMHNGSQFMCTVDGGSNTVKLDLKAGPKEGAVNLENVFFDIPTGYSYKGEININKQVLKGTTQITTDDTFYAGVFTKGDDGVYNLFTVVTLVQNDTVTVEVPLGGKDGTEPINYYILETDADGNILDLDVFEYEVTGEGTVALSKDNLAGNINLVNKIPEDTDGKLRVQKTDGNGVGLAGASFRLTDEDGSVIDEWTSEASAHELELEPGTYTLTEVQAPTGYTGAGSVTIKVDDDYNFSVSGEIDYSYKGGLLKIVNKATPSTPSSGTPVSGGSTPASYSSALSGKVAVKTGDNTPIGAYAAVLVIAALAIAGGIFYKKKRKNDK